MKRVLKWGLLGVAIAFLGAQVMRPDRTNPPVDPQVTIGARIAVPADVKHLLDRSCTDCHTHSTVWPWYTNVAPMSWVVARHVVEGREHLNFDAWSSYTDYEAQKLLEEIAEEVLEKKMPLPQYLPLHPEATLVDGERQRIAQWARSERDAILARLGESGSSGGEGREDHDHR